MIDIKEKTTLIESFYETLQGVKPNLGEIKPGAEKWSLNEIVGHLVDSAANNHQRFVRLQIADKLEFSGYDAEEWIAVQKYNKYPWKSLVDMWYSYNSLLLHVIENVNPGALEHVWIVDGNPLTLGYIIEDYYTHLEWHINQFHQYKGEL